MDVSGFDSKDGPVRKYPTEFALNMVGNPILLTQQQDFAQLEVPRVVERLKENPCHIYMICRRPRISIDPTSFKVDGESVSLDFMVQIEDKELRIKSISTNEGGVSDLQIDSAYPHTRFMVRAGDGEKLVEMKAAVLAASLNLQEIRQFLDLEVLYVGQAYGQEGSRTAPDRLLSHATLQVIYSEAIAESPDKEIWLMLWSFSPMLIAATDGRWKAYQTSDEEDDSHCDKVFGEPMTEQQQINFTEAAMIRYFQPPFNKTFKSKFPSPAHATYAECYSLDLNSISVEMNTENMLSRIYSDAIPAKWHHIANFSLHSTDERRSMFAVLIPDECAK